MADQQARHVLSGYKVLDFTQYIAGPTATRMMAEMGAEVIKVEMAPKGDQTRGMPYLKDNRSGYFVQQNLGKKSLCIDIRKEAGLDIIKDLIPRMDVLVENFGPGTIKRLGLGYDVAKALNPKIVMCSISTFGQDGPLANQPGWDFIGACYSGVIDMVGEPDQTPVLPGLAIGDTSTGVHALAAIACALLYRERGGSGQHLDVSLLDAYFTYHDTGVHAYSLSAGSYLHRRWGRQHPLYTPIGLFDGHDHPICIMGPLDNQWAGLCRAMGRPDLVTDQRFATAAERVKNQAQVIKIVQDWIERTPDGQALAALEENRVPAAPVLSVAEAMAHPHLRQRGTVRTVSDPIVGHLELPGLPLRFSAFPQPLQVQAPLLGQHNLEVLREHLGYSDQRVKELEAQAILVSQHC
jgi:crotonobetainyl-CoA:carnitine CoA-transferase CaiB-like acyl-CoA transferase